MAAHSPGGLTQSLAEELPGCRDTSALYRRWQRTVSQAGFRYWAHLSFGPKGEPIVESNYPKIWLKHYFDENYLSIDPVITEASTARVPYLWHEAAAKIALSRRQQQFFQEANAYGLALGAGIPLWSALGRQGLISLVPDLKSPSEFDRYYQHTRIDLLAAANLLHAQVTHLRNREIHARVTLTPREQDCLDLLLRGLTTASIARRLGLTDRGVQFHVDNLKSKYGVKTRLQLLARFI